MTRAARAAHRGAAEPQKDLMAPTRYEEESSSDTCGSYRPGRDGPGVKEITTTSLEAPAATGQRGHRRKRNPGPQKPNKQRHPGPRDGRAAQPAPETRRKPAHVTEYPVRGAWGGGADRRRTPGSRQAERRARAGAG